MNADEISTTVEQLCVQQDGFLLELSADWIVLRASENCEALLGRSHVTLINEPLGRFVQSETLHDFRNLLSRLSGMSGMARAYRMRLTDDRPPFDLAFQMIDSRLLLEGGPNAGRRLGHSFGAVAGLAAGLRGAGQDLLESGARRMRALTGFDRVTLLVGASKATSSRIGAPFPAGANASLSGGFPPCSSDRDALPVPLFPREDPRSVARAALHRALSPEERQQLIERGMSATMRVPVTLDGTTLGEFRCAHASVRRPDFELHGAAELFANFLALRLQLDA